MSDKESSLVLKPADCSFDFPAMEISTSDCAGGGGVSVRMKEFSYQRQGVIDQVGLLQNIDKGFDGVHFGTCADVVSEMGIPELRSAAEGGTDGERDPREERSVITPGLSSTPARSCLCRRQQVAERDIFLVNRQERDKERAKKGREEGLKKSGPLGVGQWFGFVGCDVVWPCL